MQSENHIESLLDDKASLERSNRKLLDLLEEAKSRLKQTMSEHQAELNERDELVQKLSRTSSKLQSHDWKLFYEQQINDKESQIAVRCSGHLHSGLSGHLTLFDLVYRI